MGTLHLGTSGYSYKDWRGIFYPKGTPQKAWLSFYAERYNTVEINATFYRSFDKSVLEKWRDSTPDSFRFTLKGPKMVTHQKKMHEVEEDVQAFFQSAEGLKQKLSVVLWQFPAQVQADTMMERFESFLALLPKTPRQVFEFRHTSWFKDAIDDLLNQHRFGFVINDSSKFPARNVTTGDLMYVRFHGPKQLYKSLYSQSELNKWAEKIRPRLENCDVYLYFNNDYDGRALQNANELREMLKE